MSNAHDETPAADGFAGFGKFVPGFDFLQNLVTQTAASAAKTSALGGNNGGLQMPGLGGWIAPTMNVEELDRRIKELKAVQFWLDQNATALKATVTALEVQKMTLATLKDMNFNMNEVASAFKAKATEGFASMAAVAPDKTDRADTTDKTKAFAGLEVPPTVFGAAAPEAAVPEAKPAKSAPPAQAAPEAAPAPPAAAGGVDPMQWWGALTQQFQAIAADAMKDVARQAAQAAPTVNKPARTPAKAPARPKPAARPTTKPATKSTTKPAIKPAAKPAAKAAVKSAVKPAAQRVKPVAAKSARAVPAKAPAKKKAAARSPKR